MPVIFTCCLLRPPPTDVFTAAELRAIVTHPLVLSNKHVLEQASAGINQVDFELPLTASMQEKIAAAFELPSLSRDTFPLRFVRGDLASHVDTSDSSTYLLYLTDGDGELVIGDEAFAMRSNRGYVFSQGTPHHTRRTLGSYRLLLGPMNSRGLAVGNGGK